MTMFSISNNLSHVEHARLLEVCFRYADVFSLTEAPRFSHGERLLFEQLQPFLLSKFETRHWFRRYIRKPYSHKIRLFRACPEAKEILASKYKNLFMRSDNEWELPEDLCFFSGKKLFMGSVTHERICYVYPENEKMRAEFMQICRWDIEIPDPAEQIILRDDYAPIETEWDR